MNNTKKEISTTSASKNTYITNFGEARRFILDVMVDLRNGDIPVDRGMAIATGMKVLNDNIQAEINMAKLAILATEKGHDFGKVVQMGKNAIGSNKEHDL